MSRNRMKKITIRVTNDKCTGKHPLKLETIYISSGE